MGDEYREPVKGTLLFYLSNQNQKNIVEMGKLPKPLPFNTFCQVDNAKMMEMGFANSK